MDVLILTDTTDKVKVNRWVADQYDIVFYPPVETQTYGLVRWKEQFDNYPGIQRLKVFAQLQGIPCADGFAWKTYTHTIPLSTLLAVFRGEG